MENWRNFISKENSQKDVLNEQEGGNFFNPDIPLKLSDVDPEKAKKVATSGRKDGDEDDDDIKADHKPDGVASVKDLKPSQSSMNIKKAMAFVLNMLWDGNQELNPGGDLGAMISKDRYIMDGHHRWIATSMIDPNLKVGGYLVQFPAKQLVAVLNTMTKGLYGEMTGKEGTGGFDQFKAEPIKKQLMQYLNAGVWQMKPEDVTQVLQKFTESQESGEGLVDLAVAKIVSNLKDISLAIPNWASKREDMPVIDGPNVSKAADSLNKGEVDWNQPVAANRKEKNK
jgi:hypothetical protein